MSLTSMNGWRERVAELKKARARLVRTRTSTGESREIRKDLVGFCANCGEQLTDQDVEEGACPKCGADLEDPEAITEDAAAKAFRSAFLKNNPVVMQKMARRIKGVGMETVLLAKAVKALGEGWRGLSVDDQQRVRELFPGFEVDPEGNITNLGSDPSDSSSGSGSGSGVPVGQTYPASRDGKSAFATEPAISAETFKRAAAGHPDAQAEICGHVVPGVAPWDQR